MATAAIRIVPPKMEARMIVRRRRYSSPCGSSGAALVQTLVQAWVTVPVDVGALRIVEMQTEYSVDG